MGRVMNQAPVTWSTSGFRLEHQVGARPSAVCSRQETIGEGSVVLGSTIEGTDGSHITLGALRSQPVFLRLTAQLARR
jgi:hypothetical protein